MTTHADTEALDRLEALADELDHIGSGTPEYAAPEVIGEGATAIRTLIIELRQERERADGIQLALDLERAHGKTHLLAALSRAEATLTRVDSLILPIAERIDRGVIGAHGPSCHLIHRDCLVLAIERALTDYDKQKEADHG